jgi:hypothetical protein
MTDINKLIIHATLAASALLAPTLAHAQQDGSNPTAGVLGLSTTTSGSLSTTGITVGVVISVINATSGEKALREYLNNERTSVVASLATGGGTAAGDLASLFGVHGSRHAHFATLLRANRRALTDALGQGAVGDEDAKAFMDQVVEMMRADDQLRADLPAHLRTTT